jgi:asparagine synthase (glutamine-hydrolysing)
LLLYEQQRQHGVVVTLDGHGGDELLAGYPGYVVSALYDEGAPLGSPRRYLDLLDIYRAMMSSPADAGPRQGFAALVWDTSTWLRNMRRLGQRVGLKLGPSAPDQTDQGGSAWLAEDFAALVPAEPTPADLVDSDALFRRHLYRDFHEAELQVILRNYDRLAMAHGVEVRMPLMDWRLVVYAFSLPPSSLLGQGYSKLILRQAMHGRVPDVVLQRRDKIGFASPVSTWFQGPWREWLMDTLSSPDFLGSDVWNGQAIRNRVAGQPQWTWQTWTQVWRYVHAHLWLRCFTGDMVAQGNRS